MRRALRILSLLLVCLATIGGTAASPSPPDDIQGKVAAVSGDLVTVRTTSVLAPKVGDAVEVYFAIAGVREQVTIATGHVTQVLSSGFTARVKPVNPEAKLKKNQLARVGTSTQADHAQIDRSKDSTGSAITPRANGPLFLEDRFDTKQLKAVPLFPATTMSFQHANDYGQLSTTAAGVLPVMYPAAHVKDFMAEFDFGVTSRLADNGYGLIFRSDDAKPGLDRYYALLFYPTKEEVALRCWDQKRWARVDQRKLRSGLLSANHMNRVRIETFGSEFRVLVNGELAATFVDSTLERAGIVGLCMLSASSQPDRVFFKNLRVYSAQARTGH